MQRTWIHLSVLAAGSLLLSCAQPGPRLPVTAQAPPLDAATGYRLGRQLHLGQQPEQALASYRAALRSDPSHVNARNGLATLYAERGDYPRAIALWRALTAQAVPGPDTAYLFSNLGYAHFLHGQYVQALAVLEQACLLDPLNHRAWQHMGSTLDQLGQHERARLMLRQAATLTTHDFKADYASAQRAGVAPIDSAVVAARPAQGWPAIEVLETASGIYALRRVGTPQAPAAPAPADIGALLEIRNGNGVTGMARLVARSMDSASLRVVRLSNQKGFGVARTRVEYLPAFRNAALRLAERMGGAPAIELGTVKDANVRLVIGRDLVARRPLAAAWGAQPVYGLNLSRGTQP